MSDFRQWWTLGLSIGVAACGDGVSLTGTKGAPEDRDAVEAGADAGNWIGAGRDAGSRNDGSGEASESSSAHSAPAATGASQDSTEGQSANGSGETDGTADVACTDGLESRVRYLAARVDDGAECSFEVQTRMCVGGFWSEWSGSYTKDSCQPSVLRPCDGESSGTVAHRQRYREAVTTIGVGCDAEVQTRECRDGSWTAWSGSFSFEECTSPTNASCGDSPHGGTETRLRYEQASVAYDAECQLELQTRTCTQGAWSTWSGSHTASTCSVLAPRACEGELHGVMETRVRYAAAVVVDGACSLEVQTRTCSDGTWSAWSGTYAQANCVAEASDPCVFGYDTCGVCGGGGPIRYYSDADGDSFGNAEEPHDSCPGADTFGLVRNASDLDPNCFTVAGAVRIESSDDVQALEHACEIAGDVEIALADDVTTIELPKLERIHGRLSVPDCAGTCGKNAHLSKLSLPLLREVVDIFVEGLPRAQVVELPSLVSVQGDLTMPRGSQLDIRSLTRVAGSALLGLPTVMAGKLEEVAGTLYLTSVAGLEFGALTSVGQLRITGAGSTIPESAFPKLRTVAGGLHVFEVPNLNHVRFPALETVQHLGLVNAPALSYQIYFPKLETIDSLTLVGTDILNFECWGVFGIYGGRLRYVHVSDNPRLVHFNCSGESDVESVRVVSNPLLTSVEMESVVSAESIDVTSYYSSLTVRFDALESVAGSVVVAGGYLDSLYMPKLNHVLGDMTVTGERGTVNLTGLEDVDGHLEIRAGADDLDLPGLRTVGGNIVIVSNELTNIEASKLERIGLNLTVFGPLVQSADFGYLQRAGGNIVIGGVPELQRLELSKLTEARSFHLEGNAKLSVLELPALERVSAWFRVGDTSILSAIHAPLLTVTNQLLIYDNAALPSCVGLSLASQVDVACQCSNNTGTGGCIAEGP